MLTLKLQIKEDKKTNSCSLKLVTPSAEQVQKASKNEQIATQNVYNLLTSELTKLSEKE